MSNIQQHIVPCLLILCTLSCIAFWVGLALFHEDIIEYALHTTEEKVVVTLTQSK